MKQPITKSSSSQHHYKRKSSRENETPPLTSGDTVPLTDSLGAKEESKKPETAHRANHKRSRRKKRSHQEVADTSSDSPSQHPTKAQGQVKRGSNGSAQVPDSVASQTEVDFGSITFAEAARIAIGKDQIKSQKDKSKTHADIGVPETFTADFEKKFPKLTPRNVPEDSRPISPVTNVRNIIEETNEADEDEGLPVVIHKEKKSTARNRKAMRKNKRELYEDVQNSLFMAALLNENPVKVPFTAESRAWKEANLKGILTHSKTKKPKTKKHVSFLLTPSEI